VLFMAADDLVSLVEIREMLRENNYELPWESENEMENILCPLNSTPYNRNILVAALKG